MPPLPPHQQRYHGSSEQLFALMDENDDGTVSLDEVKTFCSSLGPGAPNNDVIQRLFVQADTDGSGAIDKLEFDALCEGFVLLTKLSIQELVETYAGAELKRYFVSAVSLTNTDGFMPREQVRAVVDSLVSSFDLPIGSDVIALRIRKYGDEKGNYSFEQFRRLVVEEVCPEVPVLEVAGRLLQIDRERKERLKKVKTRFESRTTDQGAGTTTTTTGPCPLCEELEGEVRELRKLIETKDENLFRAEKELEEHRREEAVIQVQHATATHKLQGRVTELEEYIETLKDDLAGLRIENKGLRNREREEEEVVAFAVAAAEERAEERLQLMVEDCESFKEQIAELKQQLEDEHKRSKDLQSASAALKQRGRAAEESQRKLETLLENATEGQTEAHTLAAELKRRCQEKETKCAKKEAECETTVAQWQAKEKQLRELQNSLYERERAVRQFDRDMHNYWDTLIEDASQTLNAKQIDLEQRELDVVQAEAELTVKKELLEQRIAATEETSLPERQRRLALLRQIEQDLCVREKSLRQADTKYVKQLENCELSALREENECLKESVQSLERQLKQQQESRQYAYKDSSGGAVLAERRAGAARSRLLPSSSPVIKKLPAVTAAALEPPAAERTNRALFVTEEHPPPSRPVATTASQGTATQQPADSSATASLEMLNGAYKAYREANPLSPFSQVLGHQKTDGTIQRPSSPPRGTLPLGSGTTGSSPSPPSRRNRPRSATYLGTIRSPAAAK